MKPGSVIVDLAVEQGGNVEGVKLGEVAVTKNGVKILGIPNLPGRADGTNNRYEPTAENNNYWSQAFRFDEAGEGRVHAVMRQRTNDSPRRARCQRRKDQSARCAARSVEGSGWFARCIAAFRSAGTARRFDWRLLPLIARALLLDIGGKVVVIGRPAAAEPEPEAPKRRARREPKSEASPPA